MKTAQDLIAPLRQGLCMVSGPLYFKTFDPENGWGTYEGFVQWLIQLLEECLRYPDATLEIWV